MYGLLARTFRASVHFTHTKRESNDDQSDLPAAAPHPARASSQPNPLQLLTRTAAIVGGGSPAFLANALVLIGLSLQASCGRSNARGELWYGGLAICAFTGSQLATSTGKNPALIVTSTSLLAFSDVVLDGAGNAWVVGAGSDEVLRFPAAALRASGPATADLEIHSAALKAPGNLAFDRDGNLWVANRQSVNGTSVEEIGTVVRFDHPQDLSGVQELQFTARIQTSRPSDFLDVGAIAFDAAGSLWVTSFAGMLRFDSPGTLSGDVTLAPQALIDATGYPNNVYFYSIAFDQNGALWAAAAAGTSLNSIMKLTAPGSLTGRTSPGPALTVVGAGEILPAGGLAFDASGNLWMANSESILMYEGLEALSGVVDVAPSITLEVSNSASPSLNGHLSFHPSPEGIPVYQPDPPAALRK